jgi:Nitrile hydratase, alpha chain
VFLQFSTIEVTFKMWNRFQTFFQTIPALLTPQPVRIERSLDEQLSDAIAQAVHNPQFRTQLLDRPKQALASLDIQIPPVREVLAIESTPEQTFLVIPIMTDNEVEILRAGLNSGRALRATRSRIMLEAWQDPDYKARLLANPKAVLIAEGFQIPDAATVTVLENDAEHLYLVIPNLH